MAQHNLKERSYIRGSKRKEEAPAMRYGRLGIRQAEQEGLAKEHEASALTALTTVQMLELRQRYLLHPKQQGPHEMAESERINRALENANRWMRRANGKRLHALRKALLIDVQLDLS